MLWRKRKKKKEKKKRILVIKPKKAKKKKKKMTVQKTVSRYSLGSNLSQIYCTQSRK